MKSERDALYPTMILLPWFNARCSLLPLLHIFCKRLQSRVRYVSRVKKAYTLMSERFFFLGLTSFDKDLILPFGLDPQTTGYEHGHPKLSHDPQVSHHARVILFPLIPFTSYVLGSGPSIVRCSLSAKIWAEYLCLLAGIGGERTTIHCS